MWLDFQYGTLMGIVTWRYLHFWSRDCLVPASKLEGSTMLYTLNLYQCDGFERLFFCLPSDPVRYIDTPRDTCRLLGTMYIRDIRRLTNSLITPSLPSPVWQNNRWRKMEDSLIFSDNHCEAMDPAVAPSPYSALRVSIWSSGWRS